MSYQAKVIKIMILSHSDTENEREIFLKVIYDWNAVHSQDRGILLLPIDFKMDSSQHDMEDCDLLVAALWTRLGTFAGENSEKISNRIEERAAHGGSAMLFFSTQPVVEGSVDLKQYKTFKKFREWCKSNELFKTYDNLNELKEEFALLLAKKLTEMNLVSAKELLNKNLTEETPAVLEVVEEIVVIEDAKPLAKVPSLSENAVVLLKEAKLDTTGLIIRKRMINGTTIKTNNKSFVTNNDMANVLKWEAAIRELEYKALIEDRNYNGEIYQLTAEGYRVADLI